MEVSCKVTLISHTPFPQNLVASAAKLCYSSSDIEDITNNVESINTDDYIEKLLSMGHDSPFEHITFTFGIEGVSRSFLAQITRHRIASYSVQSQRYVKCGNGIDDFNFAVPPSISEDADILKVYRDTMVNSINSYNTIADALEEKYLNNHPNCTPSFAKSLRKKAIEDARFVLPNATETKMIVTFNARSLFNFFKLRCCNRAQWEIRAVAMEMYKLAYAVCPHIFANAGPSCVSSGKCSEGQFTCGSSNMVKNKFDNIKNK